ncbi:MULTISPECIES: hypothetical protein [Yersinia]|uniref:hypothetical protein n=1 Tax=Yersinia TaxID=629 RepID=UPI001C6096CC|nr:hypothetical protein [Yersinia kristensenii]MBW5812550.1 hypothetical protein [Yersinia kristensenii]MBW5817928.1 hypothetical protein [Yersinia kristensenii]MBW5829851.1 hypothetical protein [Yersinia kristensenii]MBW5842244.1 hypothetical protein [Yersinia kristensenii]MDA5490294.1 hypothetical protein [Yersinia kristensenii]
MWLIEFTEGHLSGLTLPIESTISLTGASKITGGNSLSVAEYLSADIALVITVEENGIYLNGWKAKPVKLHDNVIYSIYGLSFFVFTEGERDPKLKRFYFQCYGISATIVFLFSIAILLCILFFVQNYQEQRIGEYFSKVEHGYIKDGKLYVFDQKIKSNLPSSWSRNTKVVSDSSYSQIAHLNVEVFSHSGKPLLHQIIEKEDHSRISVDFPEKEMQIMRLFGEHGIAFTRKGDAWQVNDLAKAGQLLKSMRYTSELSLLESDQDESQVIDSQNFPYSVFHSTQGGGYIYDEKVSYWEGSNVPDLGVIDSISAERVVFKKERKKKIYFIHK